MAMIVADRPRLRAFATSPASRIARRFHLVDFWSLTKPRITALVLVTTGVAFALASRGSSEWVRLLHTLLGTALLAGGTNALNQYLEREADARMKRTRGRPIPSGRLDPRSALWFAVAISLAGAVYLFWFVNPLTALLGSIALALYVFAYTPLKRKTSLCTLVGAVPGAIPALMGWTAARNALDAEAWVLFGIVFLWQLPHFLAIAWMYRADYARAGFRMLPVVDPEGVETGRQVVLYTLALLPVSLLTSVLGLTGALYFVGAFTLGLGFLALGLALALNGSAVRARRLFLASLAYLPALLVLMLIDKV